MADPDLLHLLAAAPAGADLSGEAALLRDRLLEMTEAYADGLLSMPKWITARDRVGMWSGVARSDDSTPRIR